MNITLTKSSMYRNLNFANTSNKTPVQNPPTPEKNYSSTPLVDLNYNKLLVNKKNISFKGAPFYPVEKKISAVLKYLQPDEIILVGDNMEKSTKLLKKSLASVNHLIKRLFFIEEPGMSHTISVTKDGSGAKQILNLSDKTLFVKGDLAKDPTQIFTAKPGEKIYANDGDYIKAGTTTFKLKDSPDELTPNISDVAKEFNFTRNDLTAIHRLNSKNLDTLLEKDGVKKLVKKITFADVGGQDSVIKSLKEQIIYPIKYPDAYKKKSVTPGTILYGPPGTGKSLVAEALANEVDAHFIKLNGLELESKWVGETEKNWRLLFDDAKDKKPTIIFIDEFDAVARKRVGSDTSRHDDKTVNQLLTLMSDLEKSKDQVHVIVATNKMELLDDAIMRSGRFGNHIEVKNPDLEGCKNILGIHSKDKAISEEFDAAKFSEKLFEQKVSGADISHIVNHAEDNAWKRAGIFEKMESGTFKVSDTDNLKIEPEDFDQALDSFAKARQINPESKKRKIGFLGLPKVVDDEKKSLQEVNAKKAG